MKIMNWKTTIAGVLVLVGIAGEVLADPGKLATPDTLGKLAVAAGLIASKDHNK